MRLHWYAALLVVFLAGFAAAQTPAESDTQTRRLIEQKIRLVEMLINSPAARNAPYGREAESAAMVEQSRQAIDAAKLELAEDRFDKAMALIDDALKSASAASRKISAGGSALSESAQRKTMEDLTVQIDMYRTSLVGLTREGTNREAAQALLDRIDTSNAQAVQHAKDGRVADANKLLAQTYKLAVEEISRLRAGQEVIMSLKFDTPAEEYAYEQRRFNSNEMLIEMMISEGRAEGDRRKLVDGFAGEGRRLKSEADGRAGAGQYDDAIGLMEKATGQLNRALQSMGVPVF